MAERYAVGYVHYDGNTYSHGAYAALREAQAAADALRETPYIKNRRVRLPVIVTDTENEELGDVSWRDRDEV